MGAARLLERRNLQARALLRYPDAYVDRIGSAAFQLLLTEGCVDGEQGCWLHVAKRSGT